MVGGNFILDTNDINYQSNSPMASYSIKVRGGQDYIQPTEGGVSPTLSFSFSPQSS